MNNFVLVLLSFFLFSFISKDGKHLYESNSTNYSYHLKDGLLHGDFAAYYKNGKKKCEGRFVLNNKVGKWCVWDSLGNLKGVKVFENSNSYSRVYPDSLFVKKIVRDEDGMVMHPVLLEKQVLWEKRIWKRVEMELPFNTKMIGRLDQLIKECLVNKVVEAFTDEEFKLIKPIVIDSIKTKDLVAILIKEDVFIDANEKLLDKRPIGICPVYKSGNKFLELGWIYYPALRKKLATEKITIPELSGVKNYDDVFCFDCLNSKVEKELNVYNRNLKDYCRTEKELEQEIERIRIQIIESEIDYWLKGVI